MTTRHDERGRAEQHRQPEGLDGRPRLLGNRRRLWGWGRHCAWTRLRELAQFARAVEAKAFPVDVSRAVAAAGLGAQRDAVFQPAACVALVEGPGDDDGAAPLDSSNEAELLAHCRATAATAARNLAAAVTKAREQAVTKDAEAPACLLDATAAQVLLGSGLVQVAAMNLAGALGHPEKMLYAQPRAARGTETERFCD